MIFAIAAAAGFCRVSMGEGDGVSSYSSGAGCVGRVGRDGGAGSAAVGRDGGTAVVPASPRI
jgi:hypothetical protein